MTEIALPDLTLLNILLGLMMFGVALTLRPADFVRIIKAPKAPAAGLVAQFVLLPAGTCLAAWLLPVSAEVALGMMLVAACPGGSFSNILTWLARGNVAVSVSMTAVSSLAATVLTPFNFALYGTLNPRTRDLMTDISLDRVDLLLLVLLVLALPMALGMTLGSRFPGFAARSEKPWRIGSMVVFLAFVAIAFGNNLDLFLDQIGTFFWVVVGHNALALLLGQGIARSLRMPVSDRRAVTLEVGIQNSGLGLVIAFTFFPELGGALLVAAFWGVWHLVSGLTLAQVWSRIPLPEDDPVRRAEAVAP
ncbi:Sodium Bile acid symporter family protein [Nocardioides dokdonensis FR1436]|uniref:Sodium Bile acid symporter family protein n=1 Tax=Nocardioides dokdonensis FR1436 TaxID=1300347 RepID=A0A1A9GHS3_9ACTN|nr:bile acid:sodium symporter family protein [Nocardioides dokdonensis]ANH37794.1 Sodium Bile acid symporter family protein [Nocardioides dokdonensis FR1436]